MYDSMDNVTARGINASFKSHLTCEEKSRGSVTGLVVYLMLSTVLSMGLNVLLLVTIVRRPNLHEPTFYFIANLIVCDIMFTGALNIIPTITNVKSEWILGKTMCQIYGFVSNAAGQVALLTITGISLERYFACCRPFMYSRLVEGQKWLKFLIYIWIHSILVSIPPFFGWGQYKFEPHLCLCQLDWEYNEKAENNSYAYFLACTLVPCISTTLLCNFRIYYEARKMQINDSMQRQETPGAILASKASRTLSVIVASFLFTYIHFMFVKIVRRCCNNSQAALRSTENVSLILFSMANYLNPFVYGMINRKFRQELKRMLGFRSRTDQSASIPECIDQRTKNTTIHQ